MLLVLLTMCFILGFVFTQITSPLGLGLVVIMFSFFISVSINLICTTSWFSLLLFMLFLSGMMIIFVYVCSLASNETHFYSFSTSYILVVVIMMMMYAPEVNKLMLVSSMLFTESDSSILMYKIYSFGVYLFAVVLIIYLLITLFVVVKISTISEGPLRAKK